GGVAVAIKATTTSEKMVPIFPCSSKYANPSNCIVDDEMPPLPDDDSASAYSITLNLRKGWNMISFPYLMRLYYENGGGSYPTIKIVRNTCDSTQLMHYDPGNSAKWETWVLGGTGTGAPFLGYWYKASRDCSITIEGNEKVDANSKYLYAGWNQIGASSSEVTFSLMTGTCTITSGPWKYNAYAKQYEKASTLIPGIGYFVKVAANCMLSENEEMPPFPTEQPIVTVYPTIRPTYYPTIYPSPQPYKPTILHRTIRDCTTDRIMTQAESLNIDVNSAEYKGLTLDDPVKNIQTIDLRVIQGGQYGNYMCKSRKLEQCELVQTTAQKQLMLDLNFDEGSGNVLKSSTNSLQATATNPIWVEGKSGKALMFNGNSYVRIPSNPALNLGDRYLIELWFQPITDPNTWSGSYQTMVSKEGEYIFRFANGHDEKGNGRILSTIDFGAGIDQHANAYLPGFRYGGGSYAGHETGDIEFVPGNWYKMEMEYDGAYLNLRVNGQTISRTKTSRNKVSGNNDLYIGSHINGIDRLIGIIDEVKIWSTSASMYDPKDIYYDEWCEYGR
ncbi:MAG: LamG-like jellyroll fold domain-containing protein, partial [Candidatus Micrarchaeota archaeon]